VSRAADAAGVAKYDGVIVALQGRLEWSDADLAEVAGGRGVAAALMTAYQRHGERLVERLRGTFSLAIVDESRRVALIATDRLGTQPLRLANIRDVFAFASDEGSLAANPLLELDVDPQAIADYLYFHQVPAPFSIYKQVQRLLPAQYARCAAGVVELKTYWRAVFDEQRVGSWGEAAEELQRLVRRSVEENASPGTGCFLSGGVDSSTVAGMLKQAVGGDVKSFSIGFSEPGYDEMDFARISVNLRRRRSSTT
jgi:asparagine synthase (glutamine-hydrolysing)